MIEETTLHTTSSAVAPEFRVLNATDAALIWLLKWAGDADHVIANKLSTMPSRVSDVLAKTTHVGSRDKATKMAALRKD
ncbi:MAG: hypothetical protein ABJP79_15985 [Tateyamaria sp.]|uniref:hypothetical protein n=1 Tax=Tateyamaria sp. TaxID=1929288 RepID=UPI00329E4C58